MEWISTELHRCKNYFWTNTILDRDSQYKEDLGPLISMGGLRKLLGCKRELPLQERQDQEPWRIPGEYTLALVEEPET